MNDIQMKEKLVRLGVSEFDAKQIIKASKCQNISISRAFSREFAGIYRAAIMMTFVYIFFIVSLGDYEVILLFSFMYLLLMMVGCICTPYFRIMLWSFKVLISLRGK